MWKGGISGLGGLAGPYLDLDYCQSSTIERGVFTRGRVNDQEGEVRLNGAVPYFQTSFAERKGGKVGVSLSNLKRRKGRKEGHSSRGEGGGKGNITSPQRKRKNFHTLFGGHSSSLSRGGKKGDNCSLKGKG